MGAGKGIPHLVQELGSDDSRGTVATPRPEGMRGGSSYQNLEEESCQEGSAATSMTGHRQGNKDLDIALPLLTYPSFLLPHSASI